MHFPKTIEATLQSDTPRCRNITYLVLPNYDTNVSKHGEICLTFASSITLFMGRNSFS